MGWTHQTQIAFTGDKVAENLKPFVASSAIVDPSVFLGQGTKVWHFTQIASEANIGSDVTIGANVYIGSKVEIGDSSKVQNNCLIYDPSKIGRGVFVGPGVVFTNDHNPRAVNPDFGKKDASDWIQTGVLVEDGASIGAGAVCVSPVTIGAWSLVASGSIVTKNVKPYSLVAGNPARQIGWVGKHGYKLSQKEGYLQCPISMQEFVVVDDQLIERGAE
jgi:acetyltransferase-like isoleucine patch superfamily enzyme